MKSGANGIGPKGVLLQHKLYVTSLHVPTLGFVFLRIRLPGTAFLFPSNLTQALSLLIILIV
jgi:hypothetical protein